jgi:hypothetical protein
MLSSAPNPNLTLRKYVTSDLRFDASSWLATVQANASWADASWADASWADASWADNADGDGDGSQPAATSDSISLLTP